MISTVETPNPPVDIDEQMNDLLAGVRADRLEARIAAAKHRAEDNVKARAAGRRRLVKQLAEILGITFPEERVETIEWECEETRIDGDAYFEARVGGFTFSYRYPNRWTWREERRALCVQRRCQKGCHTPIWLEVESKSELLDALEDLELQRHRWECRVEFDDDGNRITDDDGNPLPRLKPVPAPDPMVKYDASIASYAHAVAVRRDLEFARPIAKATAIQHLLDEKRATSATAAEKMVETDQVYAAHCRALTDAVVAEIEAREYLLIARKNAGVGPMDDTFTDWRSE